MRARALEGGSFQTEFDQMLDPRYSPTYVRAMLAALVADDAPVPKDWLSGHVYVVHAADVQAELSAVGLAEFLTFDEAVVQWEEEARAPKASFSLSADLLVVVADVPDLSAKELGTVAQRHCFGPISTRRFVVSRRPLMRDHALCLHMAKSLKIYDQRKKAG
jgi:hypothetical protein